MGQRAMGSTEWQGSSAISAQPASHPANDRRLVSTCCVPGTVRTLFRAVRSRQNESWTLQAKMAFHGPRIQSVLGCPADPRNGYWHRSVVLGLGEASVIRPRPPPLSLLPLLIPSHSAFTRRDTSSSPWACFLRTSAFTSAVPSDGET